MWAERQGRKRLWPGLTISRMLLIWFSALAFFFIWQAAEYAGLIARLAEWQFGHLGGYYPLASVLVLILLFGAPAFYVLSPRAQANRERIATPVSQAHVLSQFFACVSMALGGAALVALALASSARMSSGPHTFIVAGRGAPVLKNGSPAILAGRVRYDRMASAGASTPFGGWTVRFAPVLPAQERSVQIRYFVETREPVGSPAEASVAGILRRNALRGDLIALYRAAGYQIANPHYVLYTDTAAMRVPYLWAALQFGLISFVFGLATWYQSRRARGLRLRHPELVRSSA